MPTFECVETTVFEKMTMRNSAAFELGQQLKVIGLVTSSVESREFAHCSRDGFQFGGTVKKIMNVHVKQFHSILN